MAEPSKTPSTSGATPKPPANGKPRGILKTSSTDLTTASEDQQRKSMKWDEMNILATYHPADKDYGHMKIDDPPTPYHSDTKSESDPDDDNLDPEKLATRLEKEGESKPRAMGPDDDEVSSEEDENETAEEKAKRKAFEMKRKLHYNEYQAVKLARQLMQSTDEDEEEEEQDNSTSSLQSPNMSAGPSTSKKDMSG